MNKHHLDIIARIAASIIIGLLVLSFCYAEAANGQAVVPMQQDNCPDDEMGVYLYGNQAYRAPCVFGTSNILDLRELGPFGARSVCMIGEWLVTGFTEPNLEGIAIPIRECTPTFNLPIKSVTIKRPATPGAWPTGVPVQPPTPPFATALPRPSFVGQFLDEPAGDCWDFVVEDISTSKKYNINTFPEDLTKVFEFSDMLAKAQLTLVPNPVCQDANGNVHETYVVEYISCASLECPLDMVVLPALNIDRGTPP